MQSILAAFYVEKLAVNQVVANERIVVESRRGWRLSSGKSICNAIIRLDYVVQQSGASEAHYRGHVVHANERLDFVAPKKAFDANAFAWLDNFLMKNGRGALTYDPRWKGHAAFIAMQFYKPVFVWVASSYGWSQENHSFIFPTYRISIPGGKVYDNQFAAPPTSTSPAVCLPRPGTLDPTELQSLIKSPEWPTILAALACVLHNLIAPLYRCPRALWPKRLPKPGPGRPGAAP
jgi:hypothetical protein